MITVYGIRACDTCRKTLKWFEAQGLAHQFHDLRSDGLDPDRIRSWLGSPFADKLVNRRSTTWRGLGDTERAASGAALTDLLVKHPTLVKRPVISVGSDAGDELIAVGFDPKSLSVTLGVSP